MSLLLWIALLTMVPLQQALAQTEVFLKIRKEEFQRIDLALTLFQPMPGSPTNALAADVYQVLVNDLRWCGYFNVQEMADLSFLLDENNADSSSWAEVTAPFLVTGQYQNQEDQLIFKTLIYDVATRQVFGEENYPTEPNQIRTTGHRMADDLILQLTGEQGIASTRMVYVSARSGSKELYLMDYDGFNPTPLTFDRSITLSPDWDPRGERIAYISYRDGPPGLFIYHLTNHFITPISPPWGFNSAPAWSPDGQWLAFTTNVDGDQEIFICDAQGRHLKRLTRAYGIDTSPSWAPNGREIAFTSDRSGRPQIYLMAIDGTNLRRLTFVGDYNESPAWSPKGDKIAFVSRGETGFDIYTIDITGENLQRLTRNAGNNENPTWSPDGLHLAFSSTRNGGSDIYMIHWDGSDPIRLTQDGRSFSPSWSPRFRR